MSEFSFLWLNTILLYACITFCLSIHIISGHLSCVHLWAFVNSAAVNIEVHVSFSILVSLEYMPRSGIAGFIDKTIWCFYS